MLQYFSDIACAFIEAERKKDVKVLHYLHGLPPVKDGGLVKYALDLADGERKLGHEVQLLVPGKFEAKLDGEIEIQPKVWRGFTCNYVINPLPVTEGKRIDRMSDLYQRGSFDVFFTFLEKLSPDIIHMHSFMGMYLSFMQAAEKLGIPVVFTTHDYYGLCPKINLFRDGRICTEMDWDMCDSCMGNVVSEKKIEWQHSDLYRMLKTNRIFRWLEYSQRLLPYKIFVKNMLKKNRNAVRSLPENSQEEMGSTRCVTEEYESLRRYYQQMFKGITCFHFNSRQSRQVFEAYLGSVRGEVVPITNRRIKDNRKIYTYGDKLKIGYLGTGQLFKGYGYLKEVLDAMYQSGMTGLECHVYYNSQDVDCPYIRRHEPYSEEKLETVFRNMDVLVVPSLWKETFGMVVLEALSYGVPVIISSNVGAKELLEDNQGMGIIIDIDESKEKMHDVLEKIYYDRNILSRMNRKICEWEREWDFEKHVVQILNLYGKLF